MAGLDTASDEVTVALVGSGPEIDRVTPGSSLGRYLIIDELGRGGMGVVLHAYDPKLQREVALKRLRTTAMSSDAQARLVREARVMAKLSHPNVVAVYDVDADDDGVVIAMEYIAGHTLRHWLRDERREWPDIIEAFVRAGYGLAAAHAQGLLHRDFKPSNVLIGKDGRARVTDFGLARLETAEPSESEVAPPPASIGSSDSLSAQLTAVGTVMGTPRYMAPEQHAGKALSAAADQYAFCVSLWEALAGEAPFLDDIAAAKHRGPPPWPRTASGPAKLGEILRRGLAPDPEDRWPRMEALLDALTDEPSRHRGWWFAAAGVVTVASVGGLVWNEATQRVEPCSTAAAQLEGAWDDARRSSVEQSLLGTGVPYARDVWDRVAPRFDAYAARWVEVHDDACRATKVRGEQSDALMDLRMSCLHRARMELSAAADVLSQADADVLQKAHRLAEALPDLDRCSDVEALQAEVAPPTSRQAAAVAEARRLLALSKALYEAGLVPKAKERVDEAANAVLAVDYAPVNNEIETQRGRLHEALGEYDDAAEAFRAALRSATQWEQWEIAQAAATELVYVVGYRQAKPAVAMAYADLALGFADRTGKPEHEANVRNYLGSVHQQAGKLPEAEAEYRAGLKLRIDSAGEDHIAVAGSRNNLAHVLFAQGRFDESEAELRQAIDIRERHLGTHHPHLTSARHNLGALLFSRGKYVEAQELFEASAKQKAELLGADHPDVAAARNNAGTALQAQGKYVEAEREHRAALESLRESLGREHPNLKDPWNNLAEALQGQDRLDEAEDELRALLAMQRKILPANHPDLAHPINNLGSLLRTKGKYAEAEAEFRDAVELCEGSLPADHPDLATSQYHLGLVLMEQEQYAEALSWLEKSWKLRQGDNTPPHRRASTAFALAKTLWRGGGDRERARELAELSRDTYAESSDIHKHRAEDVEGWLAAPK